MKLYVWTAFSPDWTDGLAFAIADSLEQAMKTIRKEYGVEPGEWGELRIYKVDRKTPIGFCVSGGS